MGEEHDIDLYADDDINENENLLQEENDADLYDDIIFNMHIETAEESSKMSSKSIINNDITDQPDERYKKDLFNNVNHSKPIPIKEVLVDDKKNAGNNNEIEIKMNVSGTIQEKYEDFTTSKRTYQLHIGNLAWWTSKSEISKALQKIGINDLFELKLFENRKNGKFKGFCHISLGSHDSMKLCMEVLPTNEIHGKNPVVTLATKQALNAFESQFADPSNLNNSRSGAHRSYSSQVPLPNMKIPPPGPPYYGSQIFQQPPPPIQYQSQLDWNTAAHQQFLHPVPKVNSNNVHSQYQHSLPLPSVDEHKLSEREFEDIMEKNKTVSNLAISAAKADAKKRNYKSAEETLTTAILVINKSRVSRDIRCKLLINSLEDELNNILHNNRPRSKSRSRKRSRSKENYKYRERSRDRNIRRAKDRDYREFESRDSKRKRLNENERDCRRKIQRATDSEERRYNRRK